MILCILYFFKLLSVLLSFFILLSYEVKFIGNSFFLPVCCVSFHKTDSGDGFSLFLYTYREQCPHTTHSYCLYHRVYKCLSQSRSRTFVGEFLLRSCLHGIISYNFYLFFCILQSITHADTCMKRL